MIRNSLTVAALFSFLTILSITACPAGTISQGWTEDEAFDAYTLYGNPEYRDWAVWGKVGSISSTGTNSSTAIFQKGGYGEEAPPIMPTLYPGFGAVGGTYTVAGTVGPFVIGPGEAQNYGGIALRGEQSAGAGLLMLANLQAGETLKVWIGSYEMPFTVSASGGFSSLVSLSRPANSYGYATFTTDVADVLNVVVQLGEAKTSPFTEVYIGAAAIQAVPEPETMSLAFLGALPLLAIPKRKKV